MKIITGLLLVSTIVLVRAPEVKVAGAMKNIMMKGDLSAHINVDTMDKTNLYALGPAAGLKGEIIVLDGKVYTTLADGKKLKNTENEVPGAAMLVYSHVPKWKASTVEVTVNSYAELESLVEKTAAANGIDTDKPFAFKLSATPQKTMYHVIDWKQGVEHTMENHKQFAYAGKMVNSPVTMLGFYSRHHQGIFTHHTTFMHVHVLNNKTKTVGHLDVPQIKGLVTLYLPVK